MKQNISVSSVEALPLVLQKIKNSITPKKERKSHRKGRGREKKAVKISKFPCGVNKTKQNLCFEIKQNLLPLSYERPK